MSLLERHCQPGSGASLPQEGSQGCSSPEADYEEFIVPLNEQKEDTPHSGGSSARSSLSKPAVPLAKAAEGEAAPAPAAAALPPPTGTAEVPPAPPALPQPCSLSPAAKRTKAFHWDVVPCDKVRMKLMVAAKGKKPQYCSLCDMDRYKNPAVPQNDLDALLWVWMEQRASVLLAFCLPSVPPVFLDSKICLGIM